MSRRIVLAMLALFIAAIGAPSAAGRTIQQDQATLRAGPPAPAIVAQAQQEDEPQPTAQPEAAPSEGDGIPVEPLLTPDGRLRLDGTVQGPLDLSGWQVTLDPDDGPVFRPEAVSGQWFNLGQRLLPAINGRVHTVVVSGTDILVGGGFSNAGGVAGANCVARWDGSQWHALGQPFAFPSSCSNFFGPRVYTLALSGTEVLAGGNFFNAGGVSGANNVAKLSGATWGALGATNSINGQVFTLALSGTEVLAGGDFTDAGGVTGANSVAKLSGATWGALGATTSITGTVYTLALSGTEVLAGGSFPDAGGVTGANNVAKLSGATWGALGPTTSITGTVYTLALSGTEVLVGGDFTNAGGVSGANAVAKLSGATWGALGPVGAFDPFEVVYTLALSGTEVLAGGDFTDAGGVSGANAVAKLSGATWGALGPTGAFPGFVFNPVYTLALSGTQVLAGGNFINAGGNPNADYLAKLSGNQWQAVGGGGVEGALNDQVYTAVISGTDLLVGGFFDNAGGVAGANCVARWDGNQWHALGQPFAFPACAVRTLVVSGTEVLAGGSFTNAGGVSGANNVAKLSGGTWGALGATTSITGTVYTLALSGTEVLAGGSFVNAGGVSGANFVAKLSGGTWGALGATTSITGTVYTLALSGTEVLAGGSFVNAGGNPNADYLAKLSGATWGALGSTPLNNTVYAIAVGSAGVFVGGAFVNAGGVAEADYVARWSGSQWHALGGSGGVGALAPVGGQFPVVYALKVSGNQLFVGGSFQNAAGIAAADNLAVWNGSTWSDVGGSGNVSAIGGLVEAIAVDANDNLFVGGNFVNAAGNDLADYIVRFQPQRKVYLPLVTR